MLRFRLLTATLTAAALLAAAPLVTAPVAVAQDSGADPVVAVVNGTELRQSDVLRSAQDLPPQMQAQIGVLFPALVERLVDLTLLTQAARDAGLAEDERVRQLVADAESDAIRRVFLEDKIDAALSEEQLQAAYQDYLTENPAGEEVKARHILLESEDEAMDVIAELEGGATFEELASERSTGPSAAQGGDLGWFSKDQMVAPFSQAAFQLRPGDYTKVPVETQFGWHVIKVEDRREKPAPSFEEIEAELREKVAREVIDEQVQALREDAAIDIKAPGNQPAPGASVPQGEAPAMEAPATEAPKE